MEWTYSALLKSISSASFSNHSPSGEKQAGVAHNGFPMGDVNGYKTTVFHKYEKCYHLGIDQAGIRDEDTFVCKVLYSNDLAFLKFTQSQDV